MPLIETGDNKGGRHRKAHSLQAKPSPRSLPEPRHAHEPRSVEEQAQRPIPAKLGHFCGYGTLSLLFYRAWFVSVSGFWKGSRRGLRLEAVGLAVSSTFIIACLDEWHQSFLAG